VADETISGTPPRSSGPDPRALFPPFVSYESVRFAPGDEERFEKIDLPMRLERAVPKRRLEFRAGRFCAREALERLVPSWGRAPVPIGIDRAPVWPAGVLGSITHADGFAAAVVARAADARGLGLDSERIIDASAMDAVAELATTHGELAALVHVRLSEAVVLTLVFSAKESLFKCLYPLVGRYFDFEDATVVDVSEETSTFTTELRIPLGSFPAMARMRGRFVVADGLVHTAITLLD
jgi:enterobactin synthetase component D